MTDEPRQIANAQFLPDGTARVFDQFGDPMPEYEGPTDEVRAAIEAAAPPGAAIVEIREGRISDGRSGGP